MVSGLVFMSLLPWLVCSAVELLGQLMESEARLHDELGIEDDLASGVSLSHIG